MRSIFFTIFCMQILFNSLDVMAQCPTKVEKVEKKIQDDKHFSLEVQLDVIGADIDEKNVNLYSATSGCYLYTPSRIDPGLCVIDEIRETIIGDMVRFENLPKDIYGDEFKIAIISKECKALGFSLK